ncbi:alpha/beta hydrolase [Paenibacillus woosongensis]|uniref:Alpha/beta hydrolase n=1 Tax=Paenibacillus woosongensis TaxID=307580 RepID=A0AA95IAM2_9BACL|nr:alpha/beta hydrolase [Paenibacillus woosongensis]WHX49547.1 alpha/beta hydrolase [Paenibacillus woosongensis]
MDFINRVAPELRKGLESVPVFSLPEDLQMMREQPRKPVQSEHVHIKKRWITGADHQEMLVNIYEPIHRASKELPALLWLHGGGYVMGHPDIDDIICISFAEKTGCVVVCPDYRLAPEHPFPAGINDCYKALVWMVQAAEELGIDTTRIAVAGASAGGGLTAALTLMARDKGGPAICFQMPLYPMIDHRNETPSSYEITHPAVWNRHNNLEAWKMYLGEEEKDEVKISPYAAPFWAKSFEGLPPTYTCVGQLDPFRDETIQYVARLAQAGVDVEFQLYPGGYHAFEYTVPDAEISRRTKDGYIQALARAFNAAT